MPHYYNGRDRQTHKQSSIIQNVTVSMLRVLTAQQTVAQLRYSSPFFKMKFSLPCLQEPVTGPYSQPNDSCPTLAFYFLKIHFNIILYLGLGITNGPFSSEFLQFDP
jgi:hypothetical protein